MKKGKTLDKVSSQEKEEFDLIGRKQVEDKARKMTLGPYRKNNPFKQCIPFCIDHHQFFVYLSIGLFIKFPHSVHEPSKFLTLGYPSRYFRTNHV